MQLSKYAKHLRVSVSTFHFDKDCCMKEARGGEGGVKKCLLASYHLWDHIFGLQST